MWRPRAIITRNGRFKGGTLMPTRCLYSGRKPARVYLVCGHRAQAFFYGVMNVRLKAALADAQKIDRAMMRLTHQILERNADEDICLVGIRTRGVPLSERIAQNFMALTGRRADVGALDITLYRDDLMTKPPRALAATSIPEGGIDGALVVLVDDVLYSGRSVRSALDAIPPPGVHGF